MNLKTTFLMRNDAIDYNPMKPPGPDNPGGGLATKASQYKKALPSIEMINDVSKHGDINIMDVLWLTGDLPKPEADEKPEAFALRRDEAFQKRIVDYEAMAAYKIIVTSDVELLRLPGDTRERLIDATDVVTGNSQFMVDLLKSVANPMKVELLTDPVDCSMAYVGGDKNPTIFGMSNVMIEKNIDAIIDIFTELPSDTFETMFIGSNNVWGLDPENLNPEHKELDDALATICDIVVPLATPQQIRTLTHQSWGYVADTRFDTFCYAMIEAMLAGCWTFTGNHLIYDERPGERFESPDEAVDVIMARFATHGDKACMENVEYVRDNYSLDVFKKQFMGIVGKSL